MAGSYSLCFARNSPVGAQFDKFHPMGSSAATRLLDSPWARRLILGAFVITGIVATFACGVARQCNNFHTFRWAYWNLLAGRDLYVLHPGQHEDLFKYSPTFALFFAPFAVPPFVLALLAWNLLNGLLLYYAVSRLLPDRRGTAALALLYAGYLLTIDGTQSNGLVAALIVLAFIALEERRQVGAALAIALGALIKLFPLAALSLAIPRMRWLPFGAIFGAVCVVLVLLPLLVVSPAELLAQYGSWYRLEEIDALDRGASVMSLAHMGLGYRGPNWPLQLAGTLLLLAPLARRTAWEDPAFRLRLLSSLLLYSVLFNHKAEQPTFVLALTGIAIWYATSERSRLRDALVAASCGLMLPVFVAAIAGQWSPPAAELTLPALRIAALPFTLSFLMMQTELLGFEISLAPALTSPQSVAAEGAD